MSTETSSAVSEGKLQVQQAPVISQFPHELRVGLGDECELIANIIGIPAPDVQWLLNGNEIIENENISFKIEDNNNFKMCVGKM